MTIRSLREQTGLTQIEFARKYNIPPRTLQGWELGERTPPDYVLELLQFRIEHEQEG